MVAEYERQQQEIRQSHQLEPVRQQGASVLQLTTQELTESHRNEAISAIVYAANLTQNAFKKLNKQNQEIQQVASNGERTRQMIAARENQLRNQEKNKRHQNERSQKPKANLNQQLM